jgi:hypothetical protein
VPIALIGAHVRSVMVNIPAVEAHVSSILSYVTLIARAVPPQLIIAAKVVPVGSYVGAILRDIPAVRTPVVSVIPDVAPIGGGGLRRRLPILSVISAGGITGLRLRICARNRCSQNRPNGNCDKRSAVHVDLLSSSDSRRCSSR